VASWGWWSYRGGLRGGIVGQEGQGDLGGEPEEQLVGGGPVAVQQCAELVAGGGLGRDVVVAGSHQGLQLAGDGSYRLEPAQTMAVGAQVVGQLVAVTGIRLGSCGTPAWPGGVEGAWVDWNDGVAGGQQPVDHHAIAAFDRHRQVGGSP
jgi:hypothetical protein